VSHKSGKRAAIELSANFIVVIVISIVILAGGLTLFYKLRDNAQSYVDAIDSQTDDQLKSMMLSNNYKVAIYPNDITLDNGESQMIGIGVMNDGDSEANFGINPSYCNNDPPDSAFCLGVFCDSISYLSYFASPESDPLSVNTRNWFCPTKKYCSGSSCVLSSGFEPNKGFGLVAPKTQINKGILVTMPKNAAAGQYVLTLRIQKCSSSCTIPSNWKIYDTVKLYITNP